LNPQPGYDHRDDEKRRDKFYTDDERESGPEDRGYGYRSPRVS